MALEKSIEQPTGAVAIYWRVTRIDIDVDSKQVAINVAGYVSQEARDAGKRAIDDIWYHLEFGKEIVESVDLVAWAYAKIKALSVWADAKDILEEVEK